MPIQLTISDLTNIQQMEVAINGPDGATHLILCTGVANIGFTDHETFTFWVGPLLAKRQFVGVVASGALAAIQTLKQSQEEEELAANLLMIDAKFDDEKGRVKVSGEVSSRTANTKLSISYNVNILAEMTRY